MALSQRLNELIPRRAVLGSLMFLACMFSYVIRTNLSIIIVAMVARKKGSSRGPECGADGYVNYSSSANMTNIPSTLPDYGERYAWDQNTVGMILGAYFWGTLPSSVPGGMLAEKFGGARVVAFATLIPAVLNLLMPWAAGIHFFLIVVLRFVMGFFGSAVYPALHAMIARWVPPNEKGMFVWTMQGGPFGTFVTLSVCGLIIHSYGWKMAYYVTSGFMLMFYLLWVWLAYDTPDVHPTITEKEKNYIKEKIGTTVSKKQNKLPVKEIATSLPFLVQLYAHFANMWGIYFISISGPKYTLEILGFDMKNAGALTGLPYITRLLSGIVFASAGDYCRRNSILSVAWIRRSFMLFSHVGPAVCLLLITYYGCNRIMAVAMMVLALTFNGAACQTSLQNHQDLAPNFAGSLYGVMNTFGSFSGFIIPAVLGALTNEHNGLMEWRMMFWISAIVFASSTVLFWIFGSAEIQPWNDLTNSAKSANIEVPDEEKEMNAKDVQSSADEEENEKL